MTIIAWRLCTATSRNSQRLRPSALCIAPASGSLTASCRLPLAEVVLPTARSLHSARCEEASSSGEDPLVPIMTKPTAGMPLNQAGVSSVPRPDTAEVPFIGPLPEGITELQTVPVPVYVATENPQALADLAARDGGFFFSKPMWLCETIITTIHNAGLPWWASISLATFAGRAILFPLQVKQAQSAARMEVIKPELDLLGAKIKDSYARKDGRGFEEADRLRTKMSELMRQHRVYPWATLLSGVVGAPVWISFFFTVRKMVLRDGVGLNEGGILWFTDLTAADPYCVLPVVTSATFFAMISMGELGQTQQSQDSTQQTFRMVMKGAAVLMIPMTMWMESGIFVYWFTANTFSLTQAALLRNPKIRAFVGMPTPPKRPAADSSASPFSLENLLPQALAAPKAQPDAAMKKPNIPTAVYNRPPTKPAASQSAPASSSNEAGEDTAGRSNSRMLAHAVKRAGGKKRGRR